MQARSYRGMILWFFLALLLASAFMLGWLLWPFLSVIVLGAVVTSIFKPVYSFLQRKMSPAWASFLTCMLISAMLFVPTIFFVGILSKEAYDLYQMGRDATISDHFRTLFESSTVLERANHLLSHFDIIVSGDQLNQAVIEEMIMPTEYIKAAHETIFDGGSQ